MSRARAEAGFSLIEILVSVFIFAIIGAISVALLSSTLNARSVNEDVLDQIARLDRLRSLLREDFGQIALRDVRGGESDGLVFAGDRAGVTAMRPQSGEQVVLSFTRRGRANPGLVRARSSLLHVEYLVRGESLVRRVSDYPDLADATALSETVLLDQASDISLDFLAGTAWVRRAAVVSGAEGAGLPAAIRLRYTLPRLGDLEHIVLTSGAM